ncbi:MAG: phosphodiester glycosidase family protein [Bacillota bacterium]
MFRVLLLLVPLLIGCSAAPSADFPASPCEADTFEGSRFTTCAVRNGPIEVGAVDRSGAPYRSFAALEAELGARAKSVAFAMNAGMFDEQGRPIGLLVQNGTQLHAINLRKGGGNFHLLPNGVFLVRGNGKAEVVPSTRYESTPDVRFATQSGPMLVIDGNLHPKFDPDGESRNIRNGVGIAPDGTPVFVISEDPVSFGKFARFFRDHVKARNALYFDGAVSSLWNPAAGRRDTHSELGPMVVVFKASASAPGRGARATP